MVGEHDSEEIRKWAPTKTFEFCCTQCGINHEARDFVRSLLVHLIDHVESNNKYIELMKNNNFINEDIYQNIRTKMERGKCKL
jgi:hypothetical protein